MAALLSAPDYGRRMRWVMGIGAVLMAGCITVGPGIQMTKLPPGITWCEGAPRTIPAAPLASTQENAFFPPGIIPTCSRVLMDADPGIAQTSWHGRISFGLSTDEAGHLTSVCAFGGNFGNPTEFVTCVQESLMKSGTVLPPNLKVKEWNLIYVID